MRAVLVAVLLAAAGPALAYVAPQVLAERSRVGRLLPEEIRRAAQEVAEAASITDAPPALRAALETALPGAPPGSEAVLELYAGAWVLRRRDEVLGRYDERIALLERAGEALRGYLGLVHYHLRTGAREGDPGPALPPPAEGLAQVESEADTLTVLRTLERPRAGTPRARLRRLRDAAAADLEEVERRLRQARDARSSYREANLAWGYHLDSLAAEVGRLEDETIRRMWRGGS